VDKHVLSLTGNGPLEGEIPISGAKNAALPCLAATILSSDEVQLSNLPEVRDIQTMATLLGKLGIAGELDGPQLHVQGKGIQSDIAPYDLVKTMRASILVLGPLLARLGSAVVSLPGGCAIGARPVNLHLDGLRAMGAEIDLRHGNIQAKASKLRGAEIIFEKVTVTGTENLMMAATLAEGSTLLRNAAREPEIVDLADMLRKMGARISGDGTDKIKIQGVTQLQGAEHVVIPDRIETGTYVCAAAITRGHILISNCRPSHLSRFLEAISGAGVPIKATSSTIEILPCDELKPFDVQTQPYPGFPTDMQAQFMALMTQANGRSLITENIFENRFMHVYELNRMGADIKIRGTTAVVSGPTRLLGAQVTASDLRASASLVLAGLIAEGETRIHEISHLERGYHALEAKLNRAGASVKKAPI